MTDPSAPWHSVELTRHPERPRPPQFVTALVSDFFELHGDRSVLEDPALLAGLGRLQGGAAIVVLAQRHDVNGLGPASLRKAARLVRLAERFALPVVTFVDDPGIHLSGAAQGAMWTAVGQLIEVFLSTPVPTLAVLCGEGASGGAVALSIADRLIALQHAYLAPIAPEAAAAILWRDPTRAADAATLLRLSVADMRCAGLPVVCVDEGPGAHLDSAAVIAKVGVALHEQLAIANAPVHNRVATRHSLYRALACWQAP